MTYLRGSDIYWVHNNSPYMTYLRGSAHNSCDTGHMDEQRQDVRHFPQKIETKL